MTLKDKTVLIVDDDDRNTFALASYLETVEVKTLIVGNGAEAIALLQTGTPVDIILLDMMMPVMDGYETLSALKEDPKIEKIPVIAITAKAMKGDREKCLNAGAMDYVSKPLDLKLLVQKMVYWIDSKK
jgi:CheY-like chemotaxis protein